MKHQSQTAGAVYPGCSAEARTICVGGLSKHELLAQLQDCGIQLNEAAEALFAHPKFTTSQSISRVITVQLSVANLGYDAGATVAEIHGRALELGLSLCPLELGPHMRLQMLDQPEGFLGFPPSKHRAPPGSLTVASAELTDDDETPKGFYLRRIEGMLWLRGYYSYSEHIYSSDDRFVFCIPGSSA